jgi:methylmalonyl-CoA/ethylmalonyl-CoA epimerase
VDISGDYEMATIKSNQSAPLSGLEIKTIGLVVPDAIVTAKNYAHLFGACSWEFFDLELENCLADKSPGNRSSVRLASTSLGGLNLNLIQPLEGEDSHSRFLTEHGPGIHHVSFGITYDHDDRLGRLESAGIGIDMQASIAGGPVFTYTDTQESLCTRIEIVQSPTIPGTNVMVPWGDFNTEQKGVVDLTRKQFVQLGLVVDDVERVADQYRKLLGIENWDFVEFKSTDTWQGVFHDIPVTGMDFHIRAALAQSGKIQIELLEPVYGTSTHKDFLMQHGPGIHHISFGVIPDYNGILSSMQNEDIVVEMGGELEEGIWFTYLQTQQLLGTIFEIVRRDD